MASFGIIGKFVFWGLKLAFSLFKLFLMPNDKFLFLENSILNFIIPNNEIEKCTNNWCHGTHTHKQIYQILETLPVYYIEINELMYSCSSERIGYCS